MKKLFQIVPPIFFWIAMITVASLSIFIFLINYRTVFDNYDLVTSPNYKLVNQKIAENLVNQKDVINCDCEKTFKKAYPIVWSGKVIATFGGGEDIGVERYNKKSKYNKFYVDARGKYNGESGGEVRVRGQLIGMTCAYANTIFGKCVGEVVADEITLLNK